MSLRDIPSDILQGWKIVLVDDDAMCRDLARTILERFDATVYLATNGQEGIEVIHRVRPHLIITDMSMPIMNGWTMIETLKQDREMIETPIVALTAQSQSGDRLRAIQAGCMNYLIKPLEPANFIQKILALLDNVPNAQANF